MNLVLISMILGLYLAKLWRFFSLPKSIQLFIMRLFQDEFLVGVTGIILNEKNEVLVCKHTYRQTKWSLPGGYIKAKEHPNEGLAREIEEETGLIVSVDNQLTVKTDRETARLDISLVGRLVGGEFRPSHEVTDAGFFALDNLPVLSQRQLLLIRQVLSSKEYAVRTTHPWRKSFSWDRFKRLWQ